MRLSIVSTLYMSAPHIEEFHTRVSQAARDLVGDDYEIVLVNDGSPDDSLRKTLQLVVCDGHLVVIDLSRNFGHHKAMMTGLSHSKGELVFLIDSDLEEEPEWLAPFDEQMKREECDVVFGMQEQRRGGWFERLSGDWFYRLFRILTGLALPSNIVTARLMSRLYVNALLQHQEREVFMAGLWYTTGFDQRPHPVKKHNSSRSTYTLSRKLSLLVNSVTSFSNAPLISIFYVGVVISLLSLVYIVYLVANRLFIATPMSGWTSVMASIWLLGGLIISFNGIVGIYLSKVFSETKRRPYTIVKRIYEK
jgi:putative glycosyltransferase